VDVVTRAVAWRPAALRHVENCVARRVARLLVASADLLVVPPGIIPVPALVQLFGGLANKKNRLPSDGQNTRPVVDPSFSPPSLGAVEEP
jgi:hypothetical protein